MRRILLIGMGAGNPDYLTIQAIDALNRAEVFFIPDKGAEKAALRQLREDICARFIRHANYRLVPFAIPRRGGAEAGYGASVEAWHARLADIHARLIAEELGEEGCGAFLIWGDPALYDSTLRIIQTIQASGVALEYEVIPGITAIQALAARHRVPLNRIGEPVVITPGRRVADPLSGDAVVMLDGDQAFNRIVPDDLDIYWGAYLGTPDEVLLSGRLSSVKDEIARTREALRAKNGWIMDTYLLRKSGPS